MILRHRMAVGCEAGLLAGAAVVALFFARDLIGVEPLSTPAALAGRWFGPSGTEIDLSLVARVAGFLGFGVRLIAYTLFHFLAFMCLGVLAAGSLQFGDSWSRSLTRGAVFGLTACSAVFYGGILIANSPVVLQTPGVGAVLGANLVAGVVIGGFIHWSVLVRANEEAL